MRKAFVPIVAASLSVLAPASAYADTSLSCMYMLMRVYHAEFEACHVALPKDREDRYSRMKTGLEKFIRANAKQDAEKILSNIENDNIKRALAGLKSCQSDDFKYAQQAMDRLTTPDNEKLLQNTLTIPRDPQQGDCSG
jgi:hypothetical protein